MRACWALFVNEPCPGSKCLQQCGGLSIPYLRVALLESIPSKETSLLTTPLFFTYGRDIHIFTIRSFWPQLALSKEDKPLSLDVRNSWLQNNFFAACCSGWDCNTWSYTIIIIKIEIYELDFPALSFAASVSSFLSFNALVQEFSQYSWMSWWYVLFDPYLRAFQMVTDKCYWQGCGKGCIFHITVVYILQACVLFG